MPAKARLRTGYLYVLGVPSPDGPYKIGYSLTPQGRAQAYYRQGHKGVHVVTQRPLPWPLAMQAERYAHWLLRDRHLDHEWFNVSREDAIEAIEKATTTEMVEWYRHGHLIPATQQPKSKILNGEWISTKFPKGTRQRLQDALGDACQADFMREIVEAALDARERPKPPKPDQP